MEGSRAEALRRGLGWVVVMAMDGRGENGQWMGGWLGASLALGPNARLWIYRLLIAAVPLDLVAMCWVAASGA